LINQKLAVKILEKYGHTVEIAENGSLAVDAFKSRVQAVQQNKPFDIILVRVSMPFMGGVEATRSSFVRTKCTVGSPQRPLLCLRHMLVRPALVFLLS